MRQLKAKLAVASFTILTALSSFSTEKCAYLRNGMYAVKFEPEFTAYSDHQIHIHGNTYTKHASDGEQIKGSIERIGDCRYSMVETPVEPKPSTKIGRMITDSFGNLCLELKSFRGDSIYFRTTYTGNLHLTVNEGVLIRIRN